MFQTNAELFFFFFMILFYLFIFSSFFSYETREKKNLKTILEQEI